MTNIQSAQKPAAIALGSNLGESLSTLEQAIQTLSQNPTLTLTDQSQWYRTKPVGPPQPDYINGCALVQTALSPEALLETLLAIEDQYGRVRAERWGARTLDLDLILYGDVVIDTPRLQLPHPRMSERAFVLRPLADIAPDWVDPVTQLSIAQLLERVDCADVHPLNPTNYSAQISC